MVTTMLNGFVVGYGAVWFQLFGEQADRGDYLTSAGGYLGAAVVLALTPVAMLSPQRRRWAGAAWSWCALAVAGVLTLDPPFSLWLAAGRNDGMPFCCGRIDLV